MANKPGESPAGNPIRTRVQSTESGLAQPTFAANVVSVAREVGGFTLVFYSIPSDALDAPSAREQIQRQSGGSGAIDVTLQAEPAAKLFLPITTAAGLAQLLSDNLRAWNDTYGREMRNFIDSAKAAVEAGADPSRKPNA